MDIIEANVSTEMDVERINFMIDLFFGLLKEESMDRDRVSNAKMVKELLDLKFKYLGVNKGDSAQEAADEVKIRKRLMESGINLESKTKSKKINSSFKEKKNE